MHYVAGILLQLMQDVNTMSMEQFQNNILAVRSNLILVRLRVGWTPSFLTTCYPVASKRLKANSAKISEKHDPGHEM